MTVELTTNLGFYHNVHDLILLNSHHFMVNEILSN